MTCPSFFAIARDGTDGAGDTHRASCARCRAAADQLDDARRELFGGDEIGAARVAARRLMAAAEARRRTMRGARLRRWIIGALGAALPAALAAAAFLLWVAPDRSVRAKGELAVDLYCRRGEAVFSAQDGGDFLAGDRLRFAYTTAQAGYLVVFGVDDSGAVFPYYPARDLRGVAVAAGEKVLLPGSIELDAHRGWERAYVVWSRAPFDERALRAKVNESLHAAGGDLRRAGRLPVDAPQVSYLLRRP
jgi:hypothetical protein